ncbi:PilZ domain-containing protein [Sphingosinicella sp. LHD-64]|uniref:PilZ domain-containing protein n=1 Tax=Sphingosinicella sp. LHD-64 TaxID=3072139 RepID=UPI00280D2812|nr:PilZ domain-containing protein [Sphingosinicella sp. LHD-64]MDQ8755143.1 PilZ domain-containing protein [Sphingosinicella sp. LHD-64]
MRALLDTIYSLSGEVPLVEASVEEVDESVLQPGSLIIGSIRQVCLIRKISAGGAVLHVDTPAEEGRRLELELETGEHLDGTIVWCRGSELGLRFDQPIDVLPILARALVSQPGERRRMPRVEVFCPALLETAGRTELITVRDLAQGGAKIDTPFPLDQDARIVITPEGLRPIEGSVRWVRGTVAGISFQPELAWQEMIPWLRGRRNAPPADFHAPSPLPEVPQPTAQVPSEGAIQLSLPARVREGTRRWAIDVASLTTRAVEFDSFVPLRLGTLLWIVLPGLEGWPARIVSIDGYRFTCEFTQPLHPAVLERILSAATTQARAQA